MSEEEECIARKKKREETLAGWQLRREKRGFVLSAVLLCALHYRRQRAAACTLRNVLCIPDEGFSFSYFFFFFVFFIYSFPLYLGLCINEGSRGKKEKPKPKEMNVYEREREKEETAHSPEKKDKKTDRYMGSLPSIHIV